VATEAFPLRVMQMIAAELGTIAGVGYVGLDLFGYQQLPKSKFPAVFIVRSSGGNVETHPALQQRMELMLLVTGYVLAPSATPNGIAVARETFYQAVENALLGEGLRARFQADFVTSGQQVLPVELDGGPDTDEGQTPPFGYFSLPCRAVLHYGRGAL
jgi:hypothetical protein